MSYCSRSCRRWFILLNFKSSAFCRICGHCQQHFTAHMQKRLFRKFRYNRRFDYVFRWFFCILYAEYHSLPDPDFLTKCEISAIWRRFPLIVAFYKLKVRRISTSVFFYFYLLRQVWSWYGHPLPSYCVLAADTLRDLVALTFDVLTLTSSHTWEVGSLSQEPKNSRVALCPGQDITHARKRNPQTDLDKIWRGGRYPRRNHLGRHKFWRSSVKGLLGDGGQISPVPIDFHRRPYSSLALPCECLINWELE